MADRRYALIVATETYADERLQGLRSPAADAEALKRVLASPAIGGFEVKIVRDEEKDRLEVLIAEFFRKERARDDTLLLHFSCHGVKDDDGRLYFAARNTNTALLDATSIPSDFVVRQVDQSPSRKIILILDCCYSGAFAAGHKPRAGDGIDLKERFEGRGTGRVVLTASNSMEYAFEGDAVTDRVGGGRATGKASPSLFTSALITGLETGAAARSDRDWISVEDLYGFAHDYVQGKNSKQTPMRWVWGEAEIKIANRVRKGTSPLAASGDLDYSFLSAPFVLETPGTEIFSVAIAPDGRSLAASTDGAVLLWRGDEPITRWDPGSAPQRLDISTSFDGYAYAVVFTPDGNRFAVAGEQRVVSVHELDGTEVWSKEWHKEAVYSISCSPDGTLIATGGYDRQVILLSQDSGAVRRTRPLRGRVSCVAFSPNRDDTTVAIASLDNSIWLWDVKTGRLEALGEHTSSVERVAFSRDGNLLASCGLDKAVRLWDVRRRTGEPEWANIDEHEYLVRAVAFSPDGGTVASASWDKTIRFWNVKSGMPYRPPFEDGWPAHTDWIWDVAFSPDGRAFVSGGSDGQIIISTLPAP